MRARFPLIHSSFTGVCSHIVIKYIIDNDCFIGSVLSHDYNCTDDYQKTFAVCSLKKIVNGRQTVGLKFNFFQMSQLENFLKLKANQDKRWRSSMLAFNR